MRTDRVIHEEEQIAKEAEGLAHVREARHSLLHLGTLPQ